MTRGHVRADYRDMNVEPILSSLMDFAEGRTIAMQDILTLVKAAKRMFDPESMLEWGRAQAAAHFKVC